MLKYLADNYKSKYKKMLVGTSENNIPFYVKQGFDKYEKTIKNFFIDNYYEEIIDDSGTWGNYTNNNLKYKESTNGTEKTKNSSVILMIPTGGITELTYKGEIYSNSPTASNNIKVKYIFFIV